MARRARNGQLSVASDSGQRQEGDGHLSMSSGPAAASNLDVCMKVLAGVQEQIRFADAKAAFVFGINTLMLGQQFPADEKLR